MADKPFRVKLITPEARVLDGQAQYVQVPMWDGMRGFMANAGAVVGKLGFGELRVELEMGGVADLVGAAGGDEEPAVADERHVSQVEGTLVPDR